MLIGKKGDASLGGGGGGGDGGDGGNVSLDDPVNLFFAQ